jgi:hypothetical protein
MREPHVCSGGHEPAARDLRSAAWSVRYSCARSLQSDMDDSQGMREPPSNPGSYDRKSTSAAAYSNILCTDQSEYIYIYIYMYVVRMYVCIRCAILNYSRRSPTYVYIYISRAQIAHSASGPVLRCEAPAPWRLLPRGAISLRGEPQSARQGTCVFAGCMTHVAEIAETRAAWVNGMLLRCLPSVFAFGRPAS